MTAVRLEATLLCMAVVPMCFAGYAMGQCEHESVAPIDGMPSDDFGNSLQMDGDLLIVGAPENDTIDDSSGTAYVYRRIGGLFQLEQQLIAPDAMGYDDFGFSVSIKGDLAVVGAPRVDGIGGNSGAAYVFRHDGESWVFEQKLTAFDEALNDRFGTCVLTTGDQILIGSVQDDDGAANAGSVYVFEYDAGPWESAQKIVPDNPSEMAQFGYNIAANDTVLAVGAWQQQVEGFAAAGAVFVYELQEDWVLQQIVTAGDPAVNQWFGRDVDISDNVLLVGASGDTVDEQVEAGSAYFFTYDDGIWSQTLKTHAFDFEANDRFGWSVALGRQEATIGTAGLAIRAYRYTCEGDEWFDTGTVISAANELTGEYGWAVDMDDVMIAVSDRAADNTGVVFTFQLEGYDCNGTGTCDSLDITIGDSADDDADGIPDECVAAGDLNGDGLVDAIDLALLLGAWGSCPRVPGCIADLDIDGLIDAEDLAVLLSGWGP